MSTFRDRLRAFQHVLGQDRVRGFWRRAMFALPAAAFVLAGTAMVGYQALAGGVQTLLSSAADGQQPVALEDVRAPYSLRYPSEVLTEQARQAAMDAVPEVYDLPDSSIARRQVQLAQQILAYIADVRADEYATPEMLTHDIRAINALSLPDAVIGAILSAPPDEWAAIGEQVILVLDRVMREEVRNDSLSFIRRTLPGQISVSRFDEGEVTVITSIVDDLIAINTFYNEERTRQARQAAADAVPAEIRSFAQGQLIVRAGDVITEADMEALLQFGLLQPADRRLQGLLSAFLIMVLVTVAFALYLSRFHAELFHSTSFMILLGTIFLLFLLGARLAGPERAVQPYLYPSAALGLLLATLVGPRMALLGVALLAILYGIMANNSLLLTVMTGLGGTLGVLGLRNTERLNSYFAAGGLAAIGNVGVVLVFFLTGQPADSLGALTLIGAGAISGILAAAVAFAGLYVISALFNFPTSLRLIELSHPNQPLLQRLLREAPGTYQHSLQVANLAELAAERIGANATLTRVGALYHDVGKMHAPHFFVENQVDGVNPHDSLNDPDKSAQIIIEHVLEGERLARRHRLPARLRDFILEHHGTTRVLFFYRLAVERAGGDESAVDVAAYTYPGPCPQTRETAILMLADGCETTVRARHPQNKQEVADVVRYIFEARMDAGQLDESGLTLRDLSVIQSVFVESLQGIFHPRITYPQEQARIHLPEGALEELPAVPQDAPQDAPAAPLAAESAPLASPPGDTSSDSREASRADLRPSRRVDGAASAITQDVPPVSVPTDAAETDPPAAAP